MYQTEECSEKNKEQKTTTARLDRWDGAQGGAVLSEMQELANDKGKSLSLNVVWLLEDARVP